MTLKNLFLCLLCLATVSPALAQEEQSPPKATTEVQIDEQAGVIRFIVDGKTVATIDRSGLTVAGDVRYTGVTADIGRGGEPFIDRPPQD